MERVLKVATGVLLVALVFLYAAAKIHFFTRFGATTLAGYIGEHWPYWAGLTAVSALIWVVAWIHDKRAEGATPEKGSPTGS